MPGLWPFWSKSGDDAGDAENGGEGAGDLEAFPAVQGEGLEDVGESLKKVAWKNLGGRAFCWILGGSGPTTWIRG